MLRGSVVSRRRSNNGIQQLGMEFWTVHEYFSLKGKIRLLVLNVGIYSYVYLKFIFFLVCGFL